MTIKKFKLGSNQYAKRHKGLSNTRLTILGITAAMSIFAFSSIEPHTFNGEAVAPDHFKLLNPVVQAQAEEVTPTPTEHELIVREINDVFGEDAPKAFKLLACENHALNPKAENDNTTWGGVGQDDGIFQINTIWQGVTNKAFLFDWKINIAIAHNIFVRDGHSFKLWTCGKTLGI